MAETTNENIKKICQKLKPVLGDKIENLYSAYLAEDKEGKAKLSNTSRVYLLNTYLKV
jgi:hypothetical protein